MGTFSLARGCPHEEKKAGACKNAEMKATEMRQVAEDDKTGCEYFVEVRPVVFLRVMVFGSWSRGKARYWPSGFQAS